MTYKRIRKFFLISLSFAVLGILSSCKSRPTAPEGKNEVYYLITFGVSPENAGTITATVDGSPIESGARLKKGDEVVFSLFITGNYVIEDWIGNGVKKDGNDPYKAHLKVVEDVAVQAKLTAIANSSDPKLELKSLRMYRKPVNIANLSNVEVSVEEYVNTLETSDIDATFIYESITTPEPITVKVDKNRLDSWDNLVNLSIPPVEGKYQAWNQQVKVKKISSTAPSDIPGEVQVETIEIALLNKKGKNIPQYEDYIPVGNFTPESGGPYQAKNAKTAYVAIKVKTDGDFKIEVSNKTTYLPPKEFERGTGDDASYFIAKEVVLSKGINILEVQVKTKDKSNKGTYNIVIKYDGGPNPLDISFHKRNMIPGVYCPVQRKPLDGESPDFVWLIAIAGW